MKKLFLTFIFLHNFIFCSDSIKIGITACNSAKVNLLIGVVNADDQLRDLSKKIKADFEFAGQFCITIHEFEKFKTKQDLIKLQKHDYDFVVFLDRYKNGIEWRLYDITELQMLDGKKVYQTAENKSSIAHKIADQILPLLTGQETAFASVIVACKQISNKKRRTYHNQIHALHPVEYLNKLSDPKLVIDEQTVCVALRWHCNKPLLYYSKHTSYNLRLMSVDLAKRKSIVANFDGLNMSPTFLGDNNIILSLTKNGKGRMCQYHFDEATKKGRFESLTHDDIHAISPCFIDANRVVFCAINALNKARIAILDLKTKDVLYLTESNEHCVSPVYCKKNNSIAYCKKVDGYLQIFVYDFAKKDHTQLTFDNYDKDECSWSPCGGYLTYSVDYNKKSRIAVMNLLNKTQKFLTPTNEYWTYPTWSPVYDEIPFL